MDGWMDGWMGLYWVYWCIHPQKSIGHWCIATTCGSRCWGDVRKGVGVHTVVFARSRREGHPSSAQRLCDGTNGFCHPAKPCRVSWAWSGGLARRLAALHGTRLLRHTRGSLKQARRAPPKQFMVSPWDARMIHCMYQRSTFSCHSESSNIDNYTTIRCVHGRMPLDNSQHFSALTRAENGLLPIAFMWRWRGWPAQSVVTNRKLVAGCV